MSEGPTSGDREQQRKDNVASRRQSGLEPLPRDREEQDPEREAQTRRGAKGEEQDGAGGQGA